MRHSILLIIVVLFVCSCSDFVYARTWEDQRGRQFEGEYVSFKAGKVMIRRESDGKIFQVPLSVFSKSDQQYVESRAAQDERKRPAEKVNPAASNNRANSLDTALLPYAVANVTTKRDNTSKRVVATLRKAEGTVLLLDGQPLSRKEWRTRLAGKRAKFDRQTDGGENAVLELWIEKTVPCGDVRALLLLAQEFRFLRLAIVARTAKQPTAIARVGEIRLALPALSAPREGAREDIEEVPMHLRLGSDESGALKSIRIHNRALKSIESLHQFILGAVGVGPADIVDEATVEIEPDDALSFEHLVEAIVACKGYINSSGKFVTRAEIMLLPFPGIEEVVEELEELEIEVLELEIGDVAPVPETTDIPHVNKAFPGVEQTPEKRTPADSTNITGVSGRDSSDRDALVRGGDNQGSEASVALGLEWLANHQAPDGGWTFDHATIQKCDGRCRNSGPGLSKTRNGATALALLPFLGAGQTHMEGDHKPKVKAGLRFLLTNGKVKDKTLSFSETGGRLYSHGLCSIALCEAYAITHDKDLLAPAQMSLNYIVYAQDPVGGGWRYEPRQAGDTSVTGWQIMALKSGHKAYLTVPPQTIKNAEKFLDSVQTDGGARYGYTSPGKGNATTAIGLLCRMHLGWKHDEAALKRGTDHLDKTGPSLTNLYYSFYATQVMRHYDGETWEKWNTKMHAPLLAAQAKKGHETGSWYLPGGHGSKAGRLYSTSLSLMILEAKRDLPVKGKRKVQNTFPE